MLPTHQQRRPSSTGAPGSANQYLSKKSYRWLFLCLAFASSMWLLAPYLIHMGRPPRPGRHHHNGHPPPEFAEYPPALPARPRPPASFPHPPEGRPKGPSTEWSLRADQVRNAYLHAWTGYLKLAAPSDELLPVSNGKADKLVFCRFAGIVILNCAFQFQWVGCIDSGWAGYHVDHGTPRSIPRRNAHYCQYDIYTQ